MNESKTQKKMRRLIMETERLLNLNFVAIDKVQKDLELSAKVTHKEKIKIFRRNDRRIKNIGFKMNSAIENLIETKSISLKLSGSE